jgi:hypothetical protein
MISELAWILVAELFLSCSPGDVEDDFQRAQHQMQEIVDHTGLSTAQRNRLRADVLKAAQHGFEQVAKAGDCISIIIQLYTKEIALRETKESHPGSKDIGWGYFLIERAADHPGNSPAASSYIIEVFLYREGN